MKKTEHGNRGVVKGTSSGILISLIVHAAVFLLAGMLVVFTVVKKEEQAFDPPQPIERPKMKLKKPKVRIKKSTRPKSAARIATVKKSSMPVIELPGMGGIADGLGDDIVGMDLAPNLGDVTLLGTKTSIGNDFEGTYYDFKRDRAGRPQTQNVNGTLWRTAIRKFFEKDWDPAVFSRYYRSPRKLYTTMMIVPPTQSGIAPLAFGDSDTAGALWMVHYKGKLVHKDGIKFRFWGTADEFLAVRVDGEIVLGAYWPGTSMRGYVMSQFWESSSMDSDKHWYGDQYATAGDWITLEPGVAKDMEILIGDNGGIGCFLLAVEEEGVEYERYHGAPILPAFKTEEPSHDLLDKIYQEFPANEFCLTNGPVFRDY